MTASAELKRYPKSRGLKALLKAEDLLYPLFPRVAADVGKGAGRYPGCKGAVPENAGNAFVQGVSAARGNEDRIFSVP